MDGSEGRRNAGRLANDSRLIVYNICILLGVASVASGVYLKFGLGYALIAAGGLVIGLSVFSVTR